MKHKGGMKGARGGNGWGMKHKGGMKGARGAMDERQGGNQRGPKRE